MQECKALYHVRILGRKGRYRDDTYSITYFVRVTIVPQMSLERDQSLISLTNNGTALFVKQLKSAPCKHQGPQPLPQQVGRKRGGI